MYEVAGGTCYVYVCMCRVCSNLLYNAIPDTNRYICAGTDTVLVLVLSYYTEDVLYTLLLARVMPSNDPLFVLCH